MPSYTDTADGIIIEVDAPLWRSHYDWFWPDKGCEAQLSARLTLRRDKNNTSTPIEKHTEAHREK